MKPNKLQRTALLAVAGVIVAVQLHQFADNGVEGVGWVLAFAVAAGLAFVAFSGSRKPERADALHDGGSSLPERVHAATAPPSTTPPQSEPQRSLTVNASSDGPTSTSSIPAAVVPPQRPTHPFGNTDVELFISSAHALHQEILMPWLYERLGRDSDGMMKGGLRMVGTNKETGQSFSYDDVMNAYMQEAALGYCFGVLCFLATVHSNNWQKTPAARAARDRIASDLETLLTKGTPPGLGEKLGPARRKEVAAEEVSEILDVAGLSALSFWTAYYDVLYAPPSGKKPKKGAPGKLVRGTEELRLWLENPGSRSENPLALLEMKLADRIGGNCKGPDFQSKVEHFCGPVTRRLINRAIELMDAPLAGRPSTPTSSGSPVAQS